MEKRKSLPIGLLNSTLIILALILLGCTEENDPLNFADDSQLRLKSIRSFTSAEPSQVFTVTFNYDAQGRLSSTSSNSLGQSAQLTYDANGRISQIGDYRYSYNDANQIIKIENDKLTVTSGNFIATTFEYANDQLRTQTETFSDGNTNRVNTTTLARNNRGQINSVTRTVKDVDISNGQEFIIQLDRESYTYDATGKISEIIRENDYEDGRTPIFVLDYRFDSFKNPSQLVLRSMGIERDDTLVYLAALSEKSHINFGNLSLFFSNNLNFFDQEPQSNLDSFVHWRFSIDYDYNEFGYPTSATEKHSLVNRDMEYEEYVSWEYEEF